MDINIPKETEKNETKYIPSEKLAKEHAELIRLASKKGLSVEDDEDGINFSLYDDGGHPMAYGDFKIIKKSTLEYQPNENKNIQDLKDAHIQNTIELSIPQSVDKIKAHFDYITGNNDYHGQATESNIIDKVDRYENGIKEIKKLKYLKKEVAPFLSIQQKKDFKVIDKAISKYEKTSYDQIKKELSKNNTNNKTALTRKAKQAHCSLDNSRCL